MVQGFGGVMTKLAKQADYIGVVSRGPSKQTATSTAPGIAPPKIEASVSVFSAVSHNRQTRGAGGHAANNPTLH